MDTRKKLNLLSSILGSFYKTNDEYLFHCPKCEHHKKKLSLNLEKDAFKCWVCDYHGRSIKRLVRRYGQYSQKKEWLQLTNQVEISSFSSNLFATEEQEVLKQRVNLPDEFVSLANKNLSIGTVPARKYLKDRGITKQDIIRWKIGYCSDGKYANRVVLPSFNLDGNCDFFTARTYVNDWKKYVNPPVDRDIIFNELYIDWEEDLIIVEGPFDAITAGPNSVPLLGSTLRENSKLFQKIVQHDTTVYIALDSDVERKSMGLIKKLLQYDIEVNKIDIGKYSDIGEMNKEQFNIFKENAVVMGETNYLLRIIDSI